MPIDLVPKKFVTTKKFRKKSLVGDFVAYKISKLRRNITKIIIIIRIIIRTIAYRTA